MQSAKEVSLAFQGGGAKGFEYVGCVKALKERNLVAKNIAGSSAGALQAVLVALGVQAEDLKKVMLVGSDSTLGHIDEIQDFIPKKQRQECFDTHYSLLQDYIKQGVDSLLFNLFVWPNVKSVLKSKGKSFSLEYFKSQAQDDLVPEMAINGELVYGQKLVQMVEVFLDKYLEGKIADPQKRKDITMAEFKEVVGVNLILTGSDLCDQVLRIFTAKTTPKLPVKYACRISAGFPFFFPPIYWQDSWGRYLETEKLDGHKFVDGGLILNLPTMLLSSSEYFLKKYIGCDSIPNDSIIAFSFVKDEDEENGDEEGKGCECDKGDKGETKVIHKLTKQEVASLPDRWPPILDKDYLEAVKRGQDFKHQDLCDKSKVKSIDDLKIPGLVLLKQIVATFLNQQEKLTREIFHQKTVRLDVTGIDTLNFSLEGVDVEAKIKMAQDRTEELLGKKFK